MTEGYGEISGEYLDALQRQVDRLKPSGFNLTPIDPPERERRSESYRAGRADGMREAVEIVRALEATMLDRLEGEQASIRTRDQRRIRAGAYRVAATRITTRLKVAERASKRQGIADRIERLGL